MLYSLPSAQALQTAITYFKNIIEIIHKKNETITHTRWLEDMTEEERDKFELDEGGGLEKAQEEIDQILENFYEVEL